METIFYHFSLDWKCKGAYLNKEKNGTKTGHIYQVYIQYVSAILQQDVFSVTAKSAQLVFQVPKKQCEIEQFPISHQLV